MDHNKQGSTKHYDVMMPNYQSMENTKTKMTSIKFLITFIWIMSSVKIIYSTSTDENFIFETEKLNFDEPLPTLSNGHIGYIVYGQTIYMNGLYNGYLGESHRARIPNYANIQLAACKNLSELCRYSVDLQRGIFSTKYSNDNLTVIHTNFPHRYFERTIVNQITILRNNVCENSDSSYVDLVLDSGSNSDDLIEIFKRDVFEGKQVISKEFRTRIFEDPDYQKESRNVFLIYQNITEKIELPCDKDSVNITWIMTIGFGVNDVEDEYAHVNALGHQEIFDKHTEQWMKFWSSSGITVEGNDELAKSIYSSLFYLTSSLPSLEVYYEKRYQFYGLSPSGLGLNGYQGHSFWDTEFWMQPVVLLIEPEWSKLLLNYRFNGRHAAHDNAIRTNFQGFRYPWESAYTGNEVTPDCCPEIVEFQQHITGDVALAARQYLEATHDLEWFKDVGCELAFNTALFWRSKLTFNSTLNLYEINNVMGPDEFHPNISNNAFTNVIAAQALMFGEFAFCYCNIPNSANYTDANKWSKIAQSIKLPYNSSSDYIQQYDGYIIGTEIKQADTVLLGYPLQYPMSHKTKKHNLEIYGKVTSPAGPAMTWAMHAINHLDIGEELTVDLFKKTYEPYIRKPFYVWSENADGYGGVGNFITGAGGFLQLIINGYAGIRLSVTELKIVNPRVPPEVVKLTLNGIKYYGMVFSLSIENNRNVFELKNNGGKNISIKIDDKIQDKNKVKFTFKSASTLTITPNNPLNNEHCDWKNDWTIGHPAENSSLNLMSYAIMLIFPFITYLFSI